MIELIRARRYFFALTFLIYLFSLSQVAEAIQYARPSSTVSDGGFIVSGAATHHEATDDISPNGDTDYVQADGSDTSLILGLSTVTDPMVHTGHTLRLVMIANGSGGPEKIDVDFYQNTTLIANCLVNQSPSRTSYTEYSCTLSEAEAANITDYSLLRVHIIVDTIGGGENIRTTQVVLEVPDAPLYQSGDIGMVADMGSTQSTEVSQYQTGDIGSLATLSSPQSILVTQSQVGNIGIVATISSHQSRSPYIHTGDIGAVASLASSSKGTAPFTVTVKPSGGDYSSLDAAVDGLENNFTLSTIKVFSISDSTEPTIAAGDSVTGVSSGATGVCVKVNVARDQILIKSISGGPFISGETVKKSSDAGVNVTLSDVGNPPQIYIACYSMTDTTPVTIGLNWRTSVPNSLKIYTPVSERHSGKWDAAKYNLSVGNNNAIYNSDGVTDLWIDGLQISVSGVITGRKGIHINNGNDTVAHVISNNIFKGDSGSTYAAHDGIWNQDMTGGSIKIYNNIFYDWKGIGSAGAIYDDFSFGGAATTYLYNNTSVNCNNLIGGFGGSAAVVKNNLAYSSTGWSYVRSAFSSESTNNLEGPDWGNAPGDNPRNTVSVTFKDPDNDDYHLSMTDTGAVGYGFNLSGDPYIQFNTDIDGAVRPTSWDIGADQAMDQYQTGSIGLLVTLDSDISTTGDTTQYKTGDIGSLLTLASIVEYSSAQTGNLGLLGTLSSTHYADAVLSGDLGGIAELGSSFSYALIQTGNLGVIGTLASIFSADADQVGSLGMIGDFDSDISTYEAGSQSQVGDIGMISILASSSSVSYSFSGDLGMIGQLGSQITEDASQAGDIGVVLLFDSIMRNDASQSGSIGAVATMQSQFTYTFAYIGSIGSIGTMTSAQSASAIKTGNIGAIANMYAEMSTTSLTEKWQTGNIGAIMSMASLKSVTVSHSGDIGAIGDLSANIFASALQGGNIGIIGNFASIYSVTYSYAGYIGSIATLDSHFAASGSIAGNLGLLATLESDVSTSGIVDQYQTGDIGMLATVAMSYSVTYARIGNIGALALPASSMFGSFGQMGSLGLIGNIESLMSARALLTGSIGGIMHLDSGMSWRGIGFLPAFIDYYRRMRQ
jgi:hypothetical protein